MITRIVYGRPHDPNQFGADIERVSDGWTVTVTVGGEWKRTELHRKLSAAQASARAFMQVTDLAVRLHG